MKFPHVIQSKIEIRIISLCIVSLLLFSCSSASSLIGKWETQQTTNFFQFTRNPQRGDPGYFTMEFMKDSNLVISSYTGITDTIKYSLMDSIIQITARNGFVSQVLILDISHSELTTLDTDSTIIVYRKIK